jgi:hypothetical protein
LEIHLLGADCVSFFVAVDAEAIFFGVAIRIATFLKSCTHESNVIIVRVLKKRRKYARVINHNGWRIA